MARQLARSFERPITKQLELDYLLYLPDGYREDAPQGWPLILFLHGMGQRGDDLELIKKHGIPKIVEERNDFPFVAVSPQCKESSYWPMELESLIALLDDVVTRYNVDAGRIYLTGLSMGGYGTWLLATAYPERFAAIAPICGGGFPVMASRLKDVPVWAFHGAKDETVPLSESERMVHALKACGGEVRFTVYPQAGHDAWTETYDNPELYEWFLRHRRK